jgi:hypothetical protein
MKNIPARKHDSSQVLTEIDAYETFADQAVGIDAQLLKFTRGIWSTGADSETIAAGAKFLAIVTGLRHGHIKWEGGKPVDRRMVPVKDHPLARARSELGDLDEADWPLDKDGAHSDPWVFTYELPLLDLETDGARLYATSSFGGRQSIGRLARTYAQHQRRNPGKLPVVTLGCESYKHESYGTVQKPVLKIIDWLPDPDWSPPEPSAGPAGSSRELDDEIPF